MNFGETVPRIAIIVFFRELHVQPYMYMCMVMNKGCSPITCRCDRLQLHGQDVGIQYRYPAAGQIDGSASPARKFKQIYAIVFYLLFSKITFDFIAHRDIIRHLTKGELFHFSGEFSCCWHGTHCFEESRTV